MVAYLYRMPSGVAGDVSRSDNMLLEQQQMTPNTFAGGIWCPLAYGVPMVIDNTAGNVGNVRIVKAADTAIYGLLVRPYPGNGPGGIDGLGVAIPYAARGASCDIMRRGYMNVLLSGSTAAIKGQPVYIWTAAATGTHIVGGFESTNPSASGIAIGALFSGGADANGNVEISFNI
jgi:hypothetical protein